MNPQLLDLGDGALTLEFGDRIDADLNARVIAARDALAVMHLDGVSDLVPTWRSLTVHFYPLRVDRNTVSAQLHLAAQAAPEPATRAPKWRIPRRFRR